MSEILGTNFDGTASLDATFANMRNAAVAKATDLAAVAPVAPPTPIAASPAAAAASPSGAPVAPPPVNTPPVFGAPAQDGQQPPVAPVSDPPPDTTLTEQEAADLNDSTYYRITTNGKTEAVLGSELKKRTMLHSDYTRKTQGLAEKERMLAQALGMDPRKLDANALQQLRGVIQEHQQMSQILSNPELYDRYGREVFRASQAAVPSSAVTPSVPTAQVDPNAIVSHGEVRHLVDNTVQALEAKLADLRAQGEEIPKSVAQQVQAEIQRLEDARESSRMRGQVEAHIHSVVQKHPVLNAIPDLVEVVKFNAWKMNPQNERELNHSVQTVLAGILEGIQGAHSAQARAEAANRAKILTQGIEPPTGTAPNLAPPAKLDTKDPKYWDKVSAAAKAYGR